MSAQIMADVIRIHSQIGRDERGQYCKGCNARYGYATERGLHSRASEHVAAALTAAGFGLVADAEAEFAIFRKKDPEGYPDPFDSVILSSQEQAEWHIKRNYKESTWKWLEVRTRTGPPSWARAAAVRGEG